MKKIANFGGILALLVSFVACSDATLEDFALQEDSAVQISAGTTPGTIVKTNESLSIPIGITLSRPAGKAFEVGLSINQDTVIQLIAEGKLTGVVALEAAAIMIDNVAKVQFGSDAAQFNIVIARTEVEKHFGEKLAVGYTIQDPGKGNQINSQESTGIIIIDTEEILSVEDIHYISFWSGGEVVEARNRQNYESSSGGMTIPLTISLASFPSNPFTVDIVTDADTISQMIADGTLPANTVALQEGEFTINRRISFPSNTSEVRLEVDIPWQVINDNVDKQLALVIRLENPSLHVLDTERNYTTILIDSENVIEVDVTDLGEFSVNRDNNGGPDHNEGSKKLVDGNFSSKFLQADFVGDLQCTLVFDEPQKIGAYTFTSANDANTRDPNAWHLEASNDGVNWTTIDSRSGEVFSARLMTRRFDIEFATAYTHYRLNITSIVGGTNLFQMSEWRMIRIP